MVKSKLYLIFLFSVLFAYNSNAQEFDCDEMEKDSISGIYADSTFGKLHVLDNITFAYNSNKMFSSSLVSIDKLVRAIDVNSDAEILILCHTCNIGSPRYNLRLTEKRAKAIKCYLISKGIDTFRIKTDGKGELSPIATNNTKEGRKKNERVEVAFAVK